MARLDDDRRGELPAALRLFIAVIAWVVVTSTDAAHLWRWLADLDQPVLGRDLKDLLWALEIAAAPRPAGASIR